jgi:hypothetical protein
MLLLTSSFRHACDPSGKISFDVALAMKELKIDIACEDGEVLPGCHCSSGRFPWNT